MADTSILKHLEAADAALKLAPEERDLYMRHLSNLWTDKGVDNKDGSRSTLFALTHDEDGRTYVLPTVHDGKIISPEEAIALAREQGLGVFPSYGSAEEADARYKQLHDFMERDTKDWDTVRRGPLELAPGLINSQQ